MKRICVGLNCFILNFVLLIQGCETLTLQMGLLTVRGPPKSWDDSKKDLSYIRRAGVLQFISTYNRVKDLKGDELLWGDEIEYGIFKVDEVERKIRLSLRGREVMDELNQKERENAHRVEGCNWVPEYGSWMIESTPNRPYTGYTNDLLRVERNMRLRRKRLLSVLQPDEIAPTVAVFPLLGALGDDSTVPPSRVGGPKTLSDYISDDVINPHPRFGTLTANIRKRRGEKVNIRVPLFHDECTPEFKDFDPICPYEGCSGESMYQLWRYGNGDESMEMYGKDYVIVGCAKDGLDELNRQNGGQVTLQKWLVDVKCPGCRGLYYRSSPGTIVADADWPRNGDIVVGIEIPDIPGWIRLQNGYYLPLASDDGKIQFLHKVSPTSRSSNREKTKLGSTSPLLRSESGTALNTKLDELNDDNLILEPVHVNETMVHTTDGVIPFSSSTASSSLCSSSGDALNYSSNIGQELRSVLDGITRYGVMRPAIHMDAMAFGMGCCCLQITFQAKDVDESRFMYDQLAVLAPIMMALTASTPILKGRLADTDCRWGVISESVDDRTPAERGLIQNNILQEELVGSGKRRLYKSRYDSISTYIYQGMQCIGDESMQNRVLNMYNDIPVPIDEEMYKLLRESGVDPALAQHVAHLFIRDPLVIFEGAVEEIDDSTQTDHFESIQSTNWQTVRWKPPPPRKSPNDPHIGWRTEFRSMEVQLTDFENAAFSVFVVLLTRVILTFDLNFYIPMSRVDTNMQRAHNRNASSTGKFFFRRHMAPLQEGDDGYGVKYVSMFSSAVPFFNGSAGQNCEVDEDGVSQYRRTAPVAPGSDEENAYEEMTMAEIMTGKGDYFPGLIPLVRAYLDYITPDSITMSKINRYLEFVEKRATGELITPATWIRKFVRAHPDYKKDSVISSEIAYDLMVACHHIGLGLRHEPDLLGDIIIEPVTVNGAYDVKLDAKRVHNDHLVELLQRYSARLSFTDNKERSRTQASIQEENSSPIFE